MNKEVNFEIVKLLKEKGFNMTPYLTIDNENPKNLKSNFNPREYQPWYFTLTIADVVMWLYEKHGIWIEVSCHTVFDEKDDTIEVDLFYFAARKLKPVEILYSGDFVNSPIEAYEDGILYTLNNLI